TPSLLLGIIADDAACSDLADSSSQSSAESVHARSGAVSARANGATTGRSRWVMPRLEQPSCHPRTRAEWPIGPDLRGLRVAASTPIHVGDDAAALRAATPKPR